MFNPKIAIYGQTLVNWLSDQFWYFLSPPVKFYQEIPTLMRASSSAALMSPAGCCIRFVQQFCICGQFSAGNGIVGLVY
jgi:hypothetical protein